MTLTRACSLALLLAACGPSGSDGDDDEDGRRARLTGLEWSMVGTWRGPLPDDRTAYYVFTADRSGCTWVREGDDFGRRFDEVGFHDWQLVADELDDQLRMPLLWTFDSSDEVFDDVYDVANDRILQSGLVDLPLTWTNLVIDCDDEGTNALATDAVRLGSMGNGRTGGGQTTGGGGTAPSLTMSSAASS